MGKYIVDVAEKFSWTYEGPFVFQKVFNKFFDILREKGYTAPDTFYSEYSESLNEDGTRSVKIKIKGKKDVSDYVSYEIKVKLSFDDMKRIQKGDIDIDWGKVKLQWDAVLINVDENKRFGVLTNSKNPIAQILNSVYEFVILGNEIKNHKKALMEEIQYISNRLLEELNSYRFYREILKEKNKT